VKLSYREYVLRLRHTFAIARGSVDTKQVLIVLLEHDGIVGYGEAAPSSRYGETSDTVKAFLGRVQLEWFDNPFQLESILSQVDSISEGNYSAKAAIDIALHDWMGKRLALPLHELWGLNRTMTPQTSFTIGIDRPEILAQKIEEAEQYPILKIKLGTDDDQSIMSTIRMATKKVLRVDANEGWKRKETAVEKIKWLEQQGVEFVEQPMPASDLDGTAWVRERVNLPLIADEDCVRYHDVPRLQKAFDGINIKLMKCTGLREAMKMIHTARACRMKVMLGCMIETSLAISAAAQLSPLIDYADLDGNLLITNDPFIGVRVKEGKLELPDRPGIGITEK
jgi:L-alanine-DL-glutamate epimerase-like enolase superfamily enzyme